MQHHRHAGLAGRLARGGRELEPHPEAASATARLAWFPIASRDGRDLEALEGMVCVPTRAGAMRLVSVPHVVDGLALGDEVAVADWDGEPLARGELALALAGSVRAASDAAGGWRWLAQLIDDAAGGIGTCWFDVVSDEALAASVPRARLVPVFAALTAAANVGELRWEYATPGRHG